MGAGRIRLTQLQKYYFFVIDKKKNVLLSVVSDSVCVKISSPVGRKPCDLGEWQ